MPRVTKSKTVKSFQFKGLPGWRAEALSDEKSGYKIFKDNKHIGYYNDRLKSAFIINTFSPYAFDCKNLKDAVRKIFLKTATTK